MFNLKFYFLVSMSCESNPANKQAGAFANELLAAVNVRNMKVNNCWNEWL